MGANKLGGHLGSIGSGVLGSRVVDLAVAALSPWMSYPVYWVGPWRAFKDYLRPMIKDKRLRYRYPTPQQAYITGRGEES